MLKLSPRLMANRKILRAVPNTLTLCNSLCGFAAILYTLRAYDCPPGKTPIEIFAVSALMILCAMVFDSFDGLAARLLNAASLQGIQMDSLSDMVTFGVAPATLIAVMTHRFWKASALNNAELLFIFALCSVYLGGAALRLATYNVHAMLEKKSGDTFTGLPSPGAAAALVVLVMCADVYGLEQPGNLAYLLPVYAAILGLLMVSPVPYPHGGRWIFSAWRNHKRMAVVITLILLLGVAAVMRCSILLLAVIITFYVLWGPVMWCITKLRRTKPQEA